MFGYSPKLPVLRDPQDGFGLTKSIPEAVQQNLKNLLLTSPGERVMDIDFGVGLRSALFQQNTLSLREDIQAEIERQVAKYMPFVNIQQINFGQEETFEETLNIQVRYSIGQLDAVQILELSVRP